MMNETVRLPGHLGHGQPQDRRKRGVGNARTGGNVKEYLESVEEVLKEQNSSEGGLSSQEAEKRLAQYGRNRLEEGIGLFRAGVSDRMLMSGDHGREDYDEVNLMKSYAVEAGVPSEAVFMDHAGFSTYESMYRARDIFQVRRIVIVTQNYHMYRALYIAQAMGMDAYGVPSSAEQYGGQLGRDMRELLARPKDLLYTMIKPKPKYLGEAIPVSGNGNVTNDKKDETEGLER